MPLHMLAATSATARAPREPVSAAEASATIARSSMPPAKSPQMIHLADQRDPGTEDDRADAGAEVGKDRPAAAGEPGAEPMGGDDAGKQDGQPRQARDLDPVGRDEREERRRDQEAADDAHDHGDVGAGSERRQCAPDGGRGRGRDHAIGLPSCKVSFEALPVKPVEHCQEVTGSRSAG